VPLYPALPWLASRLTSTSLGRCFSPTSATDPQYEHSLFDRLPSSGSRQEDRVDDELQSVSPSAISMRGVQTALRQSEPQVDQRLTTSLQLRTVRPHLDLVIEVRDELCSKAALSLRGVFSRAQIRRSDL